METAYADGAITPNAETLLKKRYLEPGESINQMFHRVAGGDERFEKLMRSLTFLPNSPTLMNAGTPNAHKATLSACFRFDVEDSMMDTDDSIMHTGIKAAACAKWGGGVGYYLGDLRERNAPIRSVHRVACGPVSVLHYYNTIGNRLITQGGRRELAQMGILPTWHPDIEEFIGCKNEDPQSLRTFNISASCDDEFMKRSLEAGTREHSLWDKMGASAWRTGDPGVYFYDEAERHNPTPHLGRLKGTNPCVVGETTVRIKGDEVPIRTLANSGAEVEVWNGQGWSKVTPTRTGTDKPIVRVLLGNGKFLDCTHNHGFYLQNGTRTEACLLKPGDRLEQDRNEAGSPFVISVTDMGWANEVFCFTEPKRGRGVFNGILTAQCGEVPLISGESCNLGSINLNKFVTVNREVNWNFLEEVVDLSTQFLDQILDRNNFPHHSVKTATMLTRKLGLGVMGWADMLGLMHIQYASQQAVELGSRLMKFINDVSLGVSLKLGLEKGVYPGHKEGLEVRNSTRTCIAPTGSIYLIAGADGSGIEPHFALETSRTMGDGTVLQEKVTCIEKSGGFVPDVASEVHPNWHVQHQAAFQQHTDLAVSKTVNVPNSFTKQDILDTYRLMYDLKCKGGTIYRDGSRSEQVLVSKSSKSVFSVEKSIRRRLPARRESVTVKFTVDGTECYLTVGMFDDGKPGEVFLRVSKMGSTIDGMLDSWAVTFSVALQNGTPLEDLCKHHVGTRFEPFGLTDSKEIPNCTSIPDFVARWLLKEFSKDKESKEGSGVFCPECGKEALFASGCLTCSDKACGWSKCG